jgi:LysM repeat protein
VPVDQIVNANPTVQSGLSVGQTVYIPRTTATLTTANPVVPATSGSAVGAAPATATPAPSVTNTIGAKTFVVDANGNKIHRVAAKQTLFSIARLYQVTTEDLIKWNKLTSNELNIGDDLVVGVGNKPTKAPQYVQETDDDVDKIKPATSEPVGVVNATPLPTEPITRTPAPVTPRNQPVVTASTAPTTPASPVERTVTGSGSISKVTENGMAEMLENRSENNKYLALHKTAPIGTILQVKNVSNGQSVYVRVIGKLEPTAANDKVIVKISNRAYQKLDAANSQFRVEVSYMP